MKNAERIIEGKYAKVEMDFRLGIIAGVVTGASFYVLQIAHESGYNLLLSLSVWAAALFLFQRICLWGIRKRKNRVLAYQEKYGSKR